MADPSSSGCHETNIGSCLLILLTNRSKFGVSNVFMIFLKTTRLSCHSVASSSSLGYKSASALLQPDMGAVEIHRFLSMHHSQIFFASELQSSRFYPSCDECNSLLFFHHT